MPSLDHLAMYSKLEVLSLTVSVRRCREPAGCIMLRAAAGIPVTDPRGVAGSDRGYAKSGNVHSAEFAISVAAIGSAGCSHCYHCAVV